VSDAEVHQMERAMLRLLASLCLGGRRETTLDPPLVEQRPSRHNRAEAFP
jgi:hypothetical protein